MENHKPQTANQVSVNKFRDAKLGWLLFIFSVPAIIGMICNGLQNIVNRIFVGNEVGSDALAAVAIGFPVMIIFMAVAMLIGLGSCTLASIRLGQQNREDPEKLLGQATLLLFLAPLVVAIICNIFLEDVLIFLGASSKILPYAKDYLRIILFAMVFACPSMGLNNFIRLQGHPNTAMATQILAAILNIFFNYLFIVQFNWGIKGAAWGVLLGNFLSLFWIFYFLCGKRAYVRFNFNRVRFYLPLLRKITALGLPPFLMQMAASVQQLIMNRTLTFYGGDSALAVVSILTSVSTLMVIPVIGLNQGAQPIIGYNYGARLFDRVKGTVNRAAFFATLFTTLSFILICWQSEGMAKLFTSDAEVIAMTAEALVIFFIILPLIGFMIVSTGYFQATGKPVQSAFLSLSRQVLVFIPLMLFLPKMQWGTPEASALGNWIGRTFSFLPSMGEQTLGLFGAWVTSPLSDFISFIFTVILMAYALKALRKEEKDISNLDKPKKSLISE